MRIRRTLPIALGVVAVAAAIFLAVQLRKHAPPEPARLLPGADAFLYVNYGWIRKFSNKPLVPATHDPEYERFIQETGFDYDRDLDAVAFAVHYPEGWPGGGTGGAAPEPRYSEVFSAHFDTARCSAYLRGKAQSVENYHSVDIYTIPLYGRTLRIAILGVDTVAASNHDDAAVIHGMVDRSRRLASPFGGPAMLRRYYKRVQLASPVWVAARVNPSAPPFQSWSAIFERPADIVISASYNPLLLPLHSGALHLRAEAFAGDDENARYIAEKANIFLAMFHSAEVSVGTAGSDADLKALFDSLQVKQEDSRAVLSATLPTGVLRKIMESPEQSLVSPQSQQQPQPHAKP